MTVPTEPGNVPHASTRRSRRISIIWIVPLLAVAVGAWLAWDTLSKEGPKIKVTFESGEGLQAGQSQLKYKDIVFGTVKSLELSPDKWHVVVTIATTHEAEPLLTEHTVFWVVKPRLFAGNISGLDTILSGSYIGMVPSESGGKSQRDFVGQEDPPILQAHIPGHIFLLKSPRIGSITVGSPIFFRDFNVGEVLGWDVADMAEYVTVRAFVRAPYDAYVHNETRFWNASGLSVKLGAGGIQVQMESLRALLFGGVAFDTPERDIHTAEAEDSHVFPLFANRDAARSASYTRVISGVSYFDGSVRGLEAGSEVSMHGLKIGEVTEVRLHAEADKGIIVAKVRYEVQPERIVGIGQRGFKTDDEAVGFLLDRGLRASLESTSLLTGQQDVTLEFMPDAKPMPVVKEDNEFVIPTTEASGFAQLASAATDVLNKIDTIPFKDIGANLDGILGSVNKATEGQQLKAAVDNLNSILGSVNKATSGPQLKEAVDNLATALIAAQKALNSVNKLAVSIDTGYGNDTKFSRDLDRLLVQTDEAVRSIRALADLLSQHPEALIKGRSQ
jgi:paraquat-inducible protein B